MCVALLFLVLTSLQTRTPAFANQARTPDFPKAVSAHFTFPAGHTPDSKGNFEIEVYCKALLPVHQIEIVIGHSEEIDFDVAEELVLNKETVQLFDGTMEPGEVKKYRLRGTLKKDITASVVMGIKYLYPHKEVVTHIEQDETLHPGEKQLLLMYLGFEKDNTKRTILRPLPVRRRQHQ